MDRIQTIVLISHTVIALVIIALVLLQRGKGADAGAAFGSGASGTVFGSRGSTSFFSRMTAVLATVFFATSLGLAYLSSQTSSGPASLLDDAPSVEGEEATTEAPAEVDGLPELPSTDDAVEATDDLPALPPADNSGDDAAEDPVE
jgi:preprotein translocase subunit SecG